MKIIISFLLTGISIGLLFDCFRILRKLFKFNDFIIYIQDVLFWILSGAIFMITIILLGVEIRLYVILSLILGIYIYFFTISKYIIKFVTKIFSTINKIIIKIFKIIIKIIVVPFNYGKSKIIKNKNLHF